MAYTRRKTQLGYRRKSKIRFFARVRKNGDNERHPEAKINAMRGGKVALLILCPKVDVPEETRRMQF